MVYLGPVLMGTFAFLVSIITGPALSTSLDVETFPRRDRNLNMKRDREAPGNQARRQE